MLAKAKLLLVMGEPLPLDLIYHLVAAGVDVSALERRFSK